MVKHKNIIRHFSIIFALFQLGFSQNVDISGIVLDPSGSPVSGAEVKLKNKALQTTTDANGVFSLKSGGTTDVLKQKIRTPPQSLIEYDIKGRPVDEITSFIKITRNKNMSPNPLGLHKLTQRSIDTLVVSAFSYTTKYILLDTYVGTHVVNMISTIIDTIKFSIYYPNPDTLTRWGASSIIQKKDQGFMIGGSSIVENTDGQTTGRYAYLMETDKDGNELFSQNLYILSSESIMWGKTGYKSSIKAMQVNEKGNVVVAGDADGETRLPIFYLMFDKESNLTKEKSYGLQEPGVIFNCKDVLTTNDGGFLLAIKKTLRDLNAINRYSTVLLKLNSDGDSVWVKEYPDGELNSITNTWDGGYFITGSRGFDSLNTSTAPIFTKFTIQWTMKVDSEGNGEKTPHREYVNMEFNLITAGKLYQISDSTYKSGTIHFNNSGGVLNQDDWFLGTPNRFTEDKLHYSYDFYSPNLRWYDDKGTKIFTNGLGSLINTYIHVQTNDGGFAIAETKRDSSNVPIGINLYKMDLFGNY